MGKRDLCKLANINKPMNKLYLLIAISFMFSGCMPNKRIEDVFKNVRKSVVAATQGEQTPWESSSLTGDLYFAVTQE